MRFRKIKGSSEVMLEITRKDFFDKIEFRIKQFAKLEVPTLIVWGRQEKAMPLATGNDLHELLSGSRLEVVDQAGHCPMIDQSEQFNDLVISFLLDAC